MESQANKETRIGEIKRADRSEFGHF